MQWTKQYGVGLSSSEGYKEELNQTDFRSLDILKLKKNKFFTSKQPCKTEWNVANASNYWRFFCSSLFLLKNVSRETSSNGIINSSWGGTVIESLDSKMHSSNRLFQRNDCQYATNRHRKSSTKNFEAKTAFEKKLNAKIADFNQEQFLSADYNASVLKDLYVPKAWEQQGFEGLDGVAWVRKTIVLSDEDLAGNAVLYLGKLMTKTLFYFNGKLVGQMKQWSDDRIYTIRKKF